MRDLHDDVRSLGHELVQEDQSLVASVRELLGYRGMRVYHNRHSMIVRGAKHSSNLCDVLGIVIIDDRVSEVQLEASPQVRGIVIIDH